MKTAKSSMKLGSMIMVILLSFLVHVSLIMAEQDMKNVVMTGKGCDEIYVVGEGETLHSISEKCDDPYILQENPHVEESDDVFPGLVIRISNLSARSSRKLLM